MSKLSVHYNTGSPDGFGELLAETYNAKSPINVVYSLNGNIGPDILKYSPSTKWVYRRQTDTFLRLPNDYLKGDPAQSAINWMTVLKDKADQNRTLVENWALNKADWFDPLNEPVIGTVTEARWLNTWMVTALNIGRNLGFKLAMFSFATGTPPYELWTELIPAMELGNQYGAILSLHEYSINGPMLDSVSKDLALRYRKVYSLLPNSARVSILISEASPDNGYGTGFTDGEWVADMAKYDQELMKDEYLLSACGYQLGGGESNMGGDTAEILCKYIASHPTPILTVPPEDDMKLNYVVTAYLAPQTATQEHLAIVARTASETKSTMSQSASDIRALVGLGLPGSKAIVYDPNSYPGGMNGIKAFFAPLPVEFRYFEDYLLDFWVNSPILDIPFRVTDPFNSPRLYANHLHEGVDLDCYDDPNSVAVKIYAGQDGVVEEVVNSITPGLNYGKHVVIRHDWNGQVFKTWYCHMSQVSNLTVGQKILRGEQVGVGGATGTTAIHLHFMIQWIGHGLSGYYVPDVIDPLPLIKEVIPVTYATTSGVGMGNQRLLTNVELGAIDRSKVTTVLVLTLPDYDDSKALAKQLMNKNLGVIGRLFFSVNEGSQFTPQNFVDFCWNGLRGLYDAGVRVFVVHNEPNLTQEGYGWNWANGTEFGNWLKEVISILRSKFPDIKLIYPGLSPQANTVQFFKDSLFAADLCDFVGVHAYWYTVESGQWNMTDRTGGMSWKYIADLTSKPIMLTEYSNNNPGESYENKGKQYKDYIQLLKADGRVVSAFSFALSWDQDTNREAWVANGKITPIPENLGS